MRYDERKKPHRSRPMCFVPQRILLPAANRFDPADEELFNRILQMTDNAGATEEHRALHCLTIRDPSMLCGGRRGIWAGLFADRSGGILLPIKTMVPGTAD